jgi:heptosyltransferase II
VSGEAPRAAGQREILAVRFSSLGDLVLAFPALSLIRSTHPGSRLTVLTKPEYVPLLAAVPAVDQVLPAHPGRGLPALLATARLVRSRGFDGAFDLHASLRSRAVLGLAGVPVWGRIATRPLARRRLVLAGHLRRLRNRNGEAPAGASLGAGMPLQALAMARAVVPECSTTDLRPASLRLPEPPPLPLPAPGRLRVALCPGAKHATKIWPGYRALAAQLAARGDQVLVVLGPGETWVAGGAPAIGIQGDLIGLASVLRSADVTVGNDSGLTHLAVAAGTPSVVLFGPTVPALGFLPVGWHTVVDRPELGCRPCAVHGGPRCPRGDHACLAEIPVERVLEAVDTMAAVDRLTHGHVHGR